MNKRVFFIFVGTIITGILLRVLNLGSQSVWIDEYITASFASENNIFKVFLSSYANNPHPPLFYILVHFSFKIFGASEISLRLIPLFFGIINLFIVYKLTRTFFSEEISIITLIFFSFSAYQVYYSQEARMYSIFLTFSLLIIYYFLVSIKYSSFVETPFIIFSILGLYTHLYILFLLVLINALYFIKYKEDIRQDMWIKANIIIFVFFIPLIPFAIKTVLVGGVANDVNLFLAPFYTFKSFLFGLTNKTNIIILVLCFIYFFFVLLAVFSNRRYKEKKIIDVLTVIAMFFILLPWLKSFFGEPVFSIRTLIPVSFILLLLVAIGISYLFFTVKIISIIIFLLINILSLYNYYFQFKYQKINYKNLYEKVMYFYNKNNKEIIIHTNIPSYASFEFLNNIKFKHNYNNRYISEIPEFKGSKLKMAMRQMWRKIKDNFKIDVYAGYDKNIITEKEIDETINNYSKVYLVIDDENAINQISLPNSHIWEKKFIAYKLYKLDEIEWINKYFIIKQKEEIYGCKMYILERKQ